MRLLNTSIALALLALCAHMGTAATPEAIARWKAQQAEKEKAASESKAKLVPKLSAGAQRAQLIEASKAEGPIAPNIDQSKRQNFPDPKKLNMKPRPGAYPWHFDITATYFYIGELPSQNNPTPNTKSSWDSAWNQNYGGFDDPDRSKRCPVRFIPKAFTPRLNPFYIALPYNDVEKGGPKPEAAKVIPWYKRDKRGKYDSVCRGMWVQIYYNGRYCFAQWEDCGPFVTDDWEYVFKNARPKNHSNKAAGIDISPAVRDYLGIPGGMATVHWRFVEFPLVPGGPWAKYGIDNPFRNASLPKAVQKYQYQKLKQR